MYIRMIMRQPYMLSKILNIVEISTTPKGRLPKAFQDYMLSALRSNQSVECRWVPDAERERAETVMAEGSD